MGILDSSTVAAPKNFPQNSGCFNGENPESLICKMLPRFWPVEFSIFKMCVVLEHGALEFITPLP